MAQKHQNTQYMPHCDKRDFWGRWLAGMTPWNHKYFVPDDKNPAVKTGLSYIVLLILFLNPLLCLLLYTNPWLLRYKTLPVINTQVS